MLLPRREDRERFVAQKLNHRNAARLRLSLQFLVNERVIEARARGIGGYAGIKHARRPRPVNRAQTHRTRLASGVEVATVQLKLFKRAARFAYGDDFGVRGWIVCGGDAICALGDDAAVFCDDGAEGAAAAGVHIFQSAMARRMNSADMAGFPGNSLPA